MPTVGVELYPVNGEGVRAALVPSLHDTVLVGIVTDHPDARGGYLMLPPGALNEAARLLGELAAQLRKAA